MSNEKSEDDIVLAKFINYMQKALLHKKINYLRDNNKIIEKECSINGLENQLQVKDELNLNTFNFLNKKENIILKLHILEKRTYNEISRILNLKPDSIRKIKYRAIKKIESRWKYYDKN